MDISDLAWICRGPKDKHWKVILIVYIYVVRASLGWPSKALDKHWKAILIVNLNTVRKSGVIFPVKASA